MELDLKLTSKDINEIMWSCGKTLSTAESCTAGRISAAITAVPGSSDYFKGGLICYADEVKQNLLNVDACIIQENTAVCEEVVKQMVIGANELFCTDYALAISGYAGPGGPDGGRSGVLVGTIWIAVGNKENIITRKIEEDNGRDKNLASATSIAIHMLHDFLKENCPKEEKIEEYQ
jgi:nicotinamide-nucleotide amidase